MFVAQRRWRRRGCGCDRWLRQRAAAARHRRRSLHSGRRTADQSRFLRTAAEAAGSRWRAAADTGAVADSPVGNVERRASFCLRGGLGEPISRLAATGRHDVTQVVPARARSVSHCRPLFLPDGRRFLFCVAQGDSRASIWVRWMAAPVRLTPGHRSVRIPALRMVAAVDKARVLVAQRLDVDKAELVGDPVPLAEGSGCVSAATGLVAYRSVRHAERQLGGGIDPALSWTRWVNPTHVFLSPRLARWSASCRVASEQGKLDIWLLDGARSSRVTFDGAETSDLVARWHALRIYVSADRSAIRGSLPEACQWRADPEQLLDDRRHGASTQAAGRQMAGYLLYLVAIQDATGADVWVLPITGSEAVCVPDRRSEEGASFRRTGSGWPISRESGRNEVYVRPFVEPGSQATYPAGAGQWQVSTAGGVYSIVERRRKGAVLHRPGG